MKNIKVVIGSNFGDEGKGLMTDYFCSKYPLNEKVLNVRFNGGAQAGHTCVKEYGKKHVFGHFGSGSFNENNITYLSSYFILNPILFKKEYDTLVSKGVTPVVYVHNDCILTLPCDMLLNQFSEEHRNKDRHGSCGVGIYETILRNKNYEKITIGKIRDYPETAVDITNELIQEYIPNRLSEIGIDINEKEWSLVKNKNIINNYVNDLIFMIEHIKIVDDCIIYKYNNIVFEGAQGLLLDCANEEYYPHLTPSNTGLENVMGIIKYVDDCKIEVCYVTRSYFTRHGAGKLETECDSRRIRKYGLKDKTNQTNTYQGNFRYGYFDRNTLKDAITKDLGFLNRDASIEIAITHLDETEGLIVGKDSNYSISEVIAELGVRNCYTSYGETANDIKIYKEREV